VFSASLDMAREPREGHVKFACRSYLMVPVLDVSLCDPVLIKFRTRQLSTLDGGKL
jgi:hypothetical protein